MEARRISSRATGIYKIASLSFVSLWLLLALIAAAQASEPTPLAVAFPLAGVVLVYGAYLLVGRSKKVELVGDVFVVSSRSRSIEVPIRDVESVGGSRFSNPERVWLDLRRPSEFGSRIYFLPPQRWFNFFSQHPLVSELGSMIEHGAAPGRTPVAQPGQWPLRQRIAIGAAGLFAFVAVLVVIATSMLKSSDPYEQALSIVQASPTAREQLGAPIEPGWFVTGSIRTANESGSAAMEFSVAGVHSEGVVRLAASRTERVWELSHLELNLGDRSIDLLNE